MNNNVVFSKVTNEYIPVKIKANVYEGTSLNPKMTEYDIYNGQNMIGFARIIDSDNGCYVQLIENKKPEKYREFGLLADRLEVQHCLNKKMTDFEIRAYADRNAHALHYLRGYRFKGKATAKQIEIFREKFKCPRIKSFDFNTIVKYIIDNTPKGERFDTIFLRQIPMYMPKGVIRKHIKELLKNPLIIVHGK